MKRAATEGTWDAAIRRTVWGVPIALVVIGLTILLCAQLQPSYTATVVEVGETSYTPARKLFRGTSSAYYETRLDVEYTNRQGARETTSVKFGTTNPNAIPEAGDPVKISQSPSGMVLHPDRSLIGISGGAAGIGGLFLAMLLLTMWRWKRG